MLDPRACSLDTLTRVAEKDWHRGGVASFAATEAVAAAAAAEAEAELQPSHLSTSIRSGERRVPLPTAYCPLPTAPCASLIILRPLS
jgi:hypothetical protein